MSWITGATNEDLKLGGLGPGFTRYSCDEFDRLSRQHNIMVLVGNGFDIQALHDYSRPTDSRYEPFYHYLKMRNFRSGNEILKCMEEALACHRQYGGYANWSDIENALSVALERNPGRIESVAEDLREIQTAFAQFLQMVAPSALLDEIGEDARRYSWGSSSLSEFLADIVDPEDFKALEFPKRVNHYDLFNFQFINFNYTTLLDNCIYLDQAQFDPLKHRTVDTSFLFKNDPRSHWAPGHPPDYGYSSYVVSNVVHPHGILSTPRSLLFGIDAPDNYKNRRNPLDRFSKPYWSQAHALFRNQFMQTDLFIIFGCSLGASDGWWWRNIVRSLRATKRQTYSQDHSVSPGEVVEERAELIIYRRQDADQHTVESVRDRFLDVASVGEEAGDRRELAERIRVIIYDDETPRTFLNTRSPESPG